MGLFDFFKKKDEEEEPSYDVTNMTVKDLDTGFILEYDLKTWQVKEKYEYDWGNENFSHEYKIDSGDDVVYLGVEDRGDLFMTIMRPIKIHQIPGNITQEIIRTETAPANIVFDNETYHLDGESAGYFNNVSKGMNEWEELMSWEYLNADETKILNITQWDEKTFDAVAGVVIKEFEISNIIPSGK